MWQSFQNRTSWKSLKMLSETAKQCWWKIFKSSWIPLCNRFWANSWWKKDSNGCWDWVIRTFRTTAISSSTWQQNFQIRITFHKSALRQRSSTLQSLQGVLKTSCWQKLWGLRELSWKQRESSWFCRFLQTRNNYRNCKTRFCVRSAMHRAEFCKTRN
jgi:hypothetical protein